MTCAWPVADHTGCRWGLCHAKPFSVVAGQGLQLASRCMAPQCKVIGEHTSTVACLVVCRVGA